MARGQVFTQPNQTGQIIETTSREEMNSVAILNPNDGVVYLKLNGPAGSTPSQWDWKLPSQSYGLFPGPWVSLGVYYLDQSGSGRSGELNVYDATDKLYTPYIVAIGRAVQSAGTTVDISQGTQPQNPPASSARLWIDGTGHLHVLQSNGSDFLTIDANNYPSIITLLGDVTGPVQSNIISNLAVTTAKLADNAVTTVKILDSAVITQKVLDSAITTPKVLDTAITTSKIADNAITSTKIANGAVTPAKFSTFDWRPNVIYTNDITTDRGNGSGVIFFGDGSHYLFWPGGGLVNWTLQGGSGINISGGLLSLTGISALQWDGSYINWVQPNLVLQSAARIYFGSPAAGTYFLSIDTNIAWIAHLNGMVRFYRSASGHYTDFTTGADWTLDINTQGSAVSATIFHIRSMTLCQIQVGRSANELQINQHMYGAGSGYFVLDISCTTLTQRSSLKWKHSVVPMDQGEALRKVLDKRVNLYSFQYELDELQKNADENRPPHSQKPNKDRIGFAAEEMNLVVPECVAYSTDDESPEGINYAELVTLAWGAIRELNKRIENAGI